MNSGQSRQEIEEFWNSQVLPTIKQYIEIPNQSPFFDPEWRESGHTHRAVQLVYEWVKRQNLPGSRVEVVEMEDRTPLIFLEVDGEGTSPVLLYGHLDKQPPMLPWESGLGPWTPVMRDGKLYGRGAADDGYAIFAVVSAIRVLQSQGIAHPRLTVIIEACEESGSADLPFYVEFLKDRIGTPGLVICLDSGCGNYEQLWYTTSLRGSIVGNLTVQVLTEGVHSGDASGIVPSSMRILRILLDRLEDAKTGGILPEWLHVEIPENRMEETRRTATILGSDIQTKFPFVEGMKPVSTDPLELLLNRGWRPAVAYTGQAGLPDLLQGGNVLRPETSLKLSIRIPPSLDARGLDTKLKELFESDPPYGAKVTFDCEKGSVGWQTPQMAPWLEKSIALASEEYFGQPAASFAEGGTIPFMGMLSEQFPDAQYLVTGVLGPQSNAHGPNEFLHVQTAKNLSGCVAHVLADSHKQAARG